MVIGGEEESVIISASIREELRGDLKALGWKEPAASQELLLPRNREEEHQRVEEARIVI